jgi:hypothetical protein
LGWIDRSPGHFSVILGDRLDEFAVKPTGMYILRILLRTVVFSGPQLRIMSHLPLQAREKFACNRHGRNHPQPKREKRNTLNERQHAASSSNVEQELTLELETES